MDGDGMEIASRPRPDCGDPGVVSAPVQLQKDEALNSGLHKGISGRCGT